MANAELIAALRCKSNDINDCTMCDYHNACYGGTLEEIAADALEEADKRIAELEAQLPKEGEWIEGTYNLAHNLYKCSVCGLAMITTPDYAEKHHYCYGCGAKNKVKWMKGEQE